MALFRLDRSRRAGRFLEWKVRIFVVAAVLGLAGIWLDRAWMRVAAIVLLLMGLLLRFVPEGEGEEGEEDAGVDEEDRGTQP